jgi:hypothetical protein
LRFSPVIRKQPNPEWPADLFRNGSPFAANHRLNTSDRLCDDTENMRLKVHLSTASEELIALINEGYEAISAVIAEYEARKKRGAFNDEKDVDDVVVPMNTWASKVVNALVRIFPTKLEMNLFLDPEVPFGAVSGDYKYQSTLLRCRHFVRGLNKIRLQSLPEYTDLPLDVRLYVEDIDSFRKVRDVNPAAVVGALTDGYLDRSEDSIQTSLERILNVPFHKKDWGGEVNDLYTANLVINSARHETAFLLKGNGVRARTMEIKHCGANSDQLLRLVSSPAKVFIVQFVGNVSESVVSDIDGKVRYARSQGRDAWYCIMDGQDTARVLRAYGEL